MGTDSATGCCAAALLLWQQEAQAQRHQRKILIPMLNATTKIHAPAFHSEVHRHEKYETTPKIRFRKMGSEKDRIKKYQNQAILVVESQQLATVTGLSRQQYKYVQDLLFLLRPVPQQQHHTPYHEPPSKRRCTGVAPKPKETAQLWDAQHNDIRGISTFLCFTTYCSSTTRALHRSLSIYYLLLCCVTEVVSYHASMKSYDLPLPKTRKKKEGKVVGKAGQSFLMSNELNPTFPSYMVGSLVLPPKGIKDAESVGLHAEVFTVVWGEPRSIEVAYGDPDNNNIFAPATAERFLLSQGDNFLIPPGSTYRLENHSQTTEALFSWTMIRHDGRGHADNDDGNETNDDEADNDEEDVENNSP